MPSRDQSRSDYRHFQTIPIRWMDNDIYGHVNNVNYYSFFDTEVNQYLIERGCLDTHNGNVVGFVVETSCNYFRPLAFPDAVGPASATKSVCSATTIRRSPPPGISSTSMSIAGAENR